MTALVTVAAGTGLAPLTRAAGEGSARIPWRNWSGSQECFPESRIAPASLAELQELVATARGVVRPVGAGHSFTALVPTEDTIVSLGRLAGLVAHDPETLRANVHAGTRLGDMGGPLEQVGQAMINMPDIDEQTLAGCLGTATHGTGAGIGCMSTFVESLQLVTASGEMLNCSLDRNPEIFQAARVSLGSLGIITEVTLNNVAPYRLKRETVWREFDEILEVADDLADQNRNFEFFYIPFTGMGWTDSHNITDEPVGSTGKLDGNEGANDLKLARDYLSWSPKLRELVVGTYLRSVEDEITVERSWKNYANERNVRFNEMEYHLPREHGLQAMKEIRSALEEHHNEVFFPIEFRYIKGDDIWLSPFYRRDSCSIAVHRFFEESFGPYFSTIEPIFRKYNGRPHWGKLNRLQRADFAALYPRWEDFDAVRRELDPGGKFLNPYLRQLFA